MVNKALSQALELQTELLAARPQKRVLGHSGEANHPQTDIGDQRRLRAGAVESQAISGVTVPMGVRLKMTIRDGNEKKDL